MDYPWRGYVWTQSKGTGLWTCATAAAAIMMGTGIAQAQGMPDLAVSMSASPNPVPYKAGSGYEVQVLVSNLAPPSRVIPLDGHPVSKLPGVQSPPLPPQGQDVQE